MKTILPFILYGLNCCTINVNQMGFKLRHFVTFIPIKVFGSPELTEPERGFGFGSIKVTWLRNTGFDI
jgi:hypothetical protein